MTIAQTVVHLVGIALLLLISVFCLACGLYSAAEWLEDHVKTSFRLIKRTAMLSIAMQMIWLLADRSALIPNVIGLLSHASSCVLLRHHPHHQASVVLVAAVLLLVAHQTSWVHWCLKRGNAWWQTLSILASLVWPVPTMLLLSTASNDSLPLTMSPLAGSGSRLTSGVSSPLASGVRSPLPSQSPTAGTLTVLKRNFVNDATRTWQHIHPRQPLLPEMDDVRQHRELQQAEKARLMALVGSGRAGSDIQQLLPKKQHNSMVLRGFEMLKNNVRLFLPVKEADALTDGSRRVTMSKVPKHQL